MRRFNGILYSEVENQLNWLLMPSRIFFDIKKKRGGLLSDNENGRTINLSKTRIIRVPLTSFFKGVFLLGALVSFVFNLASAPTGKDSVLKYFGVSEAAQNDTERKALEAQLSEIEKEIADHEAQIGNYQKQGKGLQSEIKALETKIAKLNLQIKAINLSLVKLDEEITTTKNQITKTETDIDSYKGSLGDVLQILNENDKSSMVEVLLKNPQISDFFADLNNLVVVQDNVNQVLSKIVVLRSDLINQKETLAVERTDTASLKAYQASQRAGIQKTQSEKTGLLKITKGKESEYQKLVLEKKKSAAEIRKQIFQLLGGGQLEFDEAYRLAKMAGDATGVRPALILAVLDRESALGKNVGKCDYKTAMHPIRDIPAFLSIIKELNLGESLNQGIIKVSCANADGAYGGAMGPAQFIPSTWALYKDKVAQISGDNPPSPWTNADAFIATALYLKDSGAGNATIAEERQAAAKYYAGGRWRRFLWTYGDRVVQAAREFEDDIDVLNS